MKLVHSESLYSIFFIFLLRKYESMFQLESFHNRTKHLYFTVIKEIKDLLKDTIKLISHRLSFI